MISLDNITDSLLKRANSEQIDMFDLILKKCVDCILNEYSEKEDGSQEGLTLPEVVVDKLEEVFKSSSLHYKDSVDIAEQFDIVFTRLNWDNSSELLSVLYPILFYSLILKNEVNRSAVDKRLQRKSTKWGSKKTPGNPSLLRNGRRWAHGARVCIHRFFRGHFK